jgi:selenide,water dikinase
LEDIVFCKGGGCTAKLGPGALDRVLSQLPRQRDERLLVGFDHSDDAAVYQLTEDLAIVQTLDFFPPMVEDPYLFGQIAAANALSDIYAMGGEVKTALNIVCFPEQWDLNILGKILQGGAEKVQEAGGVLAGGHSIQDDGVKYGLSVTGTIHPKRILQNNGARPGDRLILTKPLGVGLVCTAARMGAASEATLTRATDSMRTLNKYAADILSHYEIHGCTDVTGFGLLAHLSEMLGEEHGAILEWKAIPKLPEAEGFAEEFYLTAAAQRNRNHVGRRVQFQGLSFGAEEVLFDSQTSGGLLAAIAPAEADRALIELKGLGLPCGIIGEVTDHTSRILVR